MKMRTELQPEKIVSTEALKAARKEAGKLSELTITADGNLALNSGATFPRPDLGQFPNPEAILLKDDRKEITISFDASALLDLARAIGTLQDRVIIGIPVDANNAVIGNLPLRISGPKPLPASSALLMPCRI